MSAVVRVTLDDLRTTEALTIDLLEILSLEGQQYMARLKLGDRMVLLSEANGRTRLFRSAWQIQDTLRGLDVRETQVVHPSAYHEMVGMAADEVAPMRIRVQRRRP